MWNYAGSKFKVHRFPDEIGILSSNEGITVFGDSSQISSFCYVDDLTEGLIRMMNGSDSFVVLTLGDLKISLFYN